MKQLKQWGLSKEHTMAINMTVRRQQKDLRLQVNETKDRAKAKELHKQCNKVLHNIRKRAMNVTIEKLDSQR